MRIVGPELTSDGKPPHVPADELVAYVHGDLQRARAAAVREHAANCVECGDQLAALLLLKTASLEDNRAAGPVPPLVLPEVRNGSLRLKRVGLALASMVLLFAFVWNWPAADSSAAEAARNLRSVASEAGSKASPPDRPADQPVLPEITARHARIIHNVAELVAVIYSPDVRSVGLRTSPDDGTRIALGLAAIRMGDYEQGAAQLAAFGADFEVVGTAMLGMVQFAMGDNAAAIKTLSFYYAETSRNGGLAAGSLASPEAEAFYFLGLLHERSGEDALAMEVLGWVGRLTEAGKAATALRAEIEERLQGS